MMPALTGARLAFIRRGSRGSWVGGAAKTKAGGAHSGTPGASGACGCPPARDPACALALVCASDDRLYGGLCATGGRPCGGFLGGGFLGGGFLAGSCVDKFRGHRGSGG